MNYHIKLAIYIYIFIYFYFFTNYLIVIKRIVFIIINIKEKINVL